MPTSEWNAATSSGIDVIDTRRAITAPIEPPMATPSTTSAQPMPSAGGCEASVVATAIAMPIMPKKLPWRLDAGLDSPRSDRMNRTPATRYRTAARLAFIWSPLLSSSPRGARRSLDLLLVHREHALGNQEAAEDVDAGKDQRDEAEAARPDATTSNHGDADREQRADHDHRGDRVRHRHQRRMQRRGHRPHHEIADEHREHEDRQPEHEGIDGLRDMIHGGSPLGLRLEVRMNHGAVFGQRGGLDQFVVPFHRERLGRFVDQGLDEGKQVARIEARGGGCLLIHISEPTRQAEI